MQTLVLCCLVAAAAAAPQQFLQNNRLVSVGQPEVRILSQRFDTDQEGNYEYAYEQDNGQKMEEVGRVQPGSQPETGTITMEGSFEYVGDDGQTYQVAYVSDEGGFQPRAAHLPVAPAQIPEYAQLRAEHPELFWAENAGVRIDDQFNQRSGQFDARRGGQLIF
ncbi:cuticle protein CP14.6-like [Pollicipes pollicipes]|uniref:cuticle protein CP14.6-like n=1 Tax=Pollicipes pollicipes TaxID=41117 RepID=UPI0018850D61|nr:cuticle protein CP14.6-like [Pollicipes pollicipes]